jgi:DNA-binding transcriptional ArsR family regulator
LAVTYGYQYQATVATAQTGTGGCAVNNLHNLDDIIHVVEKTSSPPLLPIFRSRQQVELLALILGDPKSETSITDLSARLDIPFASVHREVERAERAGVLTSRKIGNTRLVRADTTSPKHLNRQVAGITRSAAPEEGLKQIRFGRLRLLGQ